ncbi:TPA: hypothetical protein ACG3I4_001943 [Clostridioides difficile]|nr:hypothetical protein [Clostridioides difficile]
MCPLIIAFVLRFIAEELDPSEAVSKACLKYGVSSSDIWDRL